ncbi:transcriptional repressor LexA [Peptococcaceae bacterium 1198_IL3148]
MKGLLILDRNLNTREQSILNVIKENIRQKGYPPSVREIGQVVGLSSSSTVHSYLKRLEDKGYIRRDPTKPRAIEILSNEFSFDRPAVVTENEEIVEVPLVGQVAAGTPITAQENVEDVINLPRSFTGYGNVFMLKVRGDSMIEAGILENDLLLVRQQQNAVNGEIVVAMLDGDATVKRFFKEKKHIRLQPENANMDPIIVDDVQIVGKIVGLIRRM